MQVALEPPALLVTRLDDSRSRLLHFGELDAHLDAQACDLDREARLGENATEEVGPVEQCRSVQEQRNFPPSMLDLRHSATVDRRVADDARDGVCVSLARREPKQQLGARVAKGGGKHGADPLGLAAPLAYVVDERPHALQSVVAGAVEAPVHRRLRTSAQRAERTRSQDGCEGRHPG